MTHNSKIASSAPAETSATNPSFANSSLANPSPTNPSPTSPSFANSSLAETSLAETSLAETSLAKPSLAETLPKAVIKILRLDETDEREFDYQTAQAAGIDLSSGSRSDITIPPKEWKLVPIGIALEIPNGFEGQIRPRSGLALNRGITVLNSPGTIDSDYRGPIQVILLNLGNDDFVVKYGHRIAQLIVAQVTHARIELADQLDVSARGSNGFGHTGR